MTFLALAFFNYYLVNQNVRITKNGDLRFQGKYLDAFSDNQASFFYKKKFLVDKVQLKKIYFIPQF